MDLCVSQVDTFRVSTDLFNTVDGSEIRRSPVEVGSWNPIIYRVLYSGARFPSSTVGNFQLLELLGDQS